ncbi:ABC transporter ATP-binding protein [Sulfobacillus sp. DSM 109850]|uniref:ABC transporter ATP-binding protein n=2 Tax=Sulfobacillus harzensis TaxID=2729629 RepID=A0A7Y0L2U7_9FIRM|nr:ABC transporter ATP-binding protein [Sulfobacillus harzensis]NMP22268.1 ABC transporter ATP-binding protein [Sulfobacillus harzensis]
MNLHKVFNSGVRGVGGIRAVSDVTFTLQRRSVVAIVGESGSGKSTVARLIAGLLPPTSGQIWLDGQRVPQRMAFHQKRQHRKNVQMIFQDPFSALNPYYTVRYHLERSLRNLVQVPKAEIKARASEALESVGLTPASDYLDKRPHELSGGQRQRLVAAQALIVEPKVILADEPTSMLDVSIRIGILNLMKRLKDENELSFVFITHDLASARYISDYILVMYAGRVIEYGKTDDVIDEPTHPYTRMLLAAVPDPKRLRGERNERIPLVGEPPNLSQLPSGCHFHPRCPYAMPECREVMPVDHMLTPDHKVACHLVKSQEAAANV